MPGFSKTRFVYLSNTENEELTCGICLDIFNNPKVVQCCRQTYCNDCITEWLSENQSCPNDRNLLTKNDLVDPPRLVQNMIAKLKIHCDHQNLGCEAVVKLESVTQHSFNCEYNPDNKKIELCECCRFIINDDEEHDCILNLKALNISLEDEISRIREESMSNSFAEKLQISNSMEQDVILSAREWVESGIEPKIKEIRGFSNNLKKKVIDISREAIENHFSFKKISENINTGIHRCENGNRWHVIVYHKKCGESLVYCDFYYIDMSFGDMRIEIFSAGTFN